MQDYRKLAVWQKAHVLAINVYRATNRIRRRDCSGITSQLRRAALSIPTNIVEGAARGSNRDFAKFLQVAIASSAEVEYELDFAAELGILPGTEVRCRQRETEEVRRMLYGLLKRVRQAPRAGPLRN